MSVKTVSSFYSHTQPMQIKAVEIGQNIWYVDGFIKSFHILQKFKPDLHLIWKDVVNECTRNQNVRSLYYNSLVRGYHTLQGDNSLKSVERFDHMMFVCRFQASRWSKQQREKLLCG